MHVSLTSSPNLLISKTGVIGPLVTEGPGPSFLTLAGKARLAAGLARAVGTHLLVARLTAGQNAGLHGHLAEVLQLAVDVEVADTAVETGAILPGGLAQGGSHIVVFPRHAWGGTASQRSGSLGTRQPLTTQMLLALPQGWQCVGHAYRRN